MAVSERRFGLEIECGCEDVFGALNIINGEGIEMELDYDGTEFELRTPVLQGDAGFEQLAFIYKTLIDHGGYVTRSDGAHVHHEALDYVGNAAMLARLVRSWVNLEPAVERCIAPYRRGNYGSCPAIQKQNARSIRRGFIDYGRGALNIHNVVASRETRDSSRFRRDDYGDRYCRYCEEDESYCYCDEQPPTIEVRSHEGSLDITLMRPWIELTQRLLDKVAEEGMTIKTCSRVDTLQARLDLPKETVNALAAKSRMVADDYTSYMSAFRSRYDW